MAEQEFYMKLTEAGLNAYARAGSGGPSVDYAFVAVGDGNGQAVRPDADWIDLVNEVWRAAPILVEIDEDSPRIVIIEMYIPHALGGFTVREVGLFDSAGIMLAVGNYPDSYKPTVANGAGVEMRARFMIEHSNATKTVLKIDPAIVMASREYAEKVAQAKINEHNSSEDSHDLLARKMTKIITKEPLSGGGDLSENLTLELDPWLSKSSEDVLEVIKKAEIEKALNTPEQLYNAIRAMIKAALPDAYNVSMTLDYFLGWYIFKSIHPAAKAGMVPVNGTLLENASDRYPKAFKYLQSPEGQILCTDEESWQAASVAVWATLADGTEISWDKCGGVCKYVLDPRTNTIRVPDLRGMYGEVEGFDGLGVGGVHGDAGREIKGGISAVQASSITGATGSFTVQLFSPMQTGNIGTAHSWTNISLNSSRTVPTANKNEPRAWGALACVYLGMPS